MSYRYTQIRFWYHCIFPTWNHWNITYTTKGLFKKRTKTLLRYLAIAAIVRGLIRAKQQGKTLKDLPAQVQGLLRVMLFFGAGVLQRAGAKV